MDGVGSRDLLKLILVPSGDMCFTPLGVLTRRRKGGFFVFIFLNYGRPRVVSGPLRAHEEVVKQLLSKIKILELLFAVVLAE